MIEVLYSPMTDLQSLKVITFSDEETMNEWLANNDVVAKKITVENGMTYLEKG